MKLAEIIERSGLSLGDDSHALSGDAAEIVVTGFAIDHRKVAPGTVFGAFRGTRVNGEDYIDAAIAAGAVAVVCAPGVRVEGAAAIRAAEPRRAFARLAAQFFVPVPAQVVAITGTNGKTSTAEMTRQLWHMAGHSSASIGTLGVTTADGSVHTGLTTPDIVTFLSNMTGLAREGVSHVAYEASSHGLAQYRIEGLPVAAGAFTSFGRDHLDYHETMDAYFAAKMRLFDEVVSDDGYAVIWNGADEWSRRAREHARKRGLRLFTVGEQDDEAQQTSDALHLLARAPSMLGQELSISYNGEERIIHLPLIGAYQAANALVAAALVIATGGDPSACFDAVSRLQPVRGRLERAAISAMGAPIYVDYAHTPDALEAAIAALRPHVEGKLITVFGAGGDRDEGKRAPMGRVASAASDIVIVTDDNPRGEDPADIRAMVIEGAPEAIEIGERRDAIGAAIAMAGASDIILIAGKGHEQGQIVGAGETMKVLPFDDVSVARECVGAGGDVQLAGGPL